MIREAARFAAGWLPQPLRAQLARRRFGYAGDGATFDVARTVRPDGTIAIAIGGGPRLLLPAGLDPDFAFHFVENADSRDEMAAFIRLSREQRHDAWLLDVGAHKGLFSIVHLMLAPEHRALLIEPSRPLAREAASLLELNGVHDRGDVLVAGAGAATATRKIAIDALGFAQVTDDPAGEDVPFTTIDDLCAARRVAPSLIKIDVEGAEADVLRGARSTLQAHHPIVCLELHFDEMERRGDSAGALLEDMVSMGYRFESTRGETLPLWRLRRSLMAIVRVVAR